MSLDRKWIVKGQILEDGEIIDIPSTIPDDYRVIQTNNPVNIFRMFGNGRFAELFIFGFDYDQSNEIIRRSLDAVVRLGVKVNDIYFCTDDDIPDKWRPIIERLRVISIDEGIALLQK